MPTLNTLMMIMIMITLIDLLMLPLPKGTHIIDTKKVGPICQNGLNKRGFLYPKFSYASKSGLEH